MERTAAAFVHRRLVQFADTDLAGIVHFSRFPLYMEEAEHAFLRSRGLSVHQTRPGGALSWPRVHVSCDYHSPARFEDVLDIAVEVAELGERKVVYRFALACGARRVATGTIVAVCCVQTDEGAERRLRSVPIPADVRAALAAAGPAVGGDVPAAPPAAP